jgi:hypothetical protein
MAAGNTYAASFADSGGQQTRLEGNLTFDNSSIQPFYPGVAGPLPMDGPYALAYDTTSLNDGVAVGYTPAIGDVFQVITITTTAFNGTTPLVDYGYTADTTGIIFAQTGAALDVSATALALTAYTVETVVDSSTSYSAWSVATAADGLLVWLSQNGQKGGTAPGGSAGAAKVYVLATTPVAF